MLSKLIKILLVLVVFIYLFYFLFFWIFESTDSFFYWAFANFIKTGTYITAYPYNYTVPSTMEPPLYSLFLFLTQLVPRADIAIHFVQLGSILLSGYLVFRISESFVRKEIAKLIGIIFLLVPAHMIYTGNLVAEPTAVFFITLYLYLLKRGSLKYLLILGAIMTLQRYNLIIFYIYAFYLNFRVMKMRVTRIFLVISLSILIGWIFINHQLNGSWGLSNSEGKHLYNRILHFDKLIPPSHNPDFIDFKKIVGEDKDYFLPWWYYEPALITALGSEKEASNLMGKVAWAAFWTNPMKYFTNNVSYFIFAHGSNPTYHDGLYLWNGNMSKNCRSLGTIEFCQPIIKNETVFKIWDNMVEKIDSFYLYISPILNYLLLYPSIVYALYQKNILFRSFALLYLASVMLFILVEAPLPRYTYVFIPMQVILTAFMIVRVHHYIKYRRG